MRLIHNESNEHGIAHSESLHDRPVSLALSGPGDRAQPKCLFSDTRTMMSMTPAETAARDLSRYIGSLPNRALRIYGDWFGKPYDNCHRCVSATADDRDLIVTFDEGEILTVQDPDGWEFNPETFRVERASKVTWRWHLYGRPKTPASLRTIEHRRSNDRVVASVSKDADLYPFAPTTDNAAVEMPPYPSR